MRSETRAASEQEVLPLALGPTTPGAAVADRTRSASDPADEPRTLRIGDELVGSRGWPSGTEVVVDRSRRPGRGDVVAVRAGDRMTVGIFDRVFGRPVLRTDHGPAWLGPGARLLGVVVVVGAALDGMPEPVRSGQRRSPEG